MPAKNDTLPKIAVFGGGFIAQYHVDGLRAAGACRIGPLVGRSEERTRKRAVELGLEEISTNAEAVLADDQIAGVVIATPDATHRDLAIGALKSGKAVLLQKPMALTSAECVDVLTATDTSTAPLTVSFMHRHFPEVRWLRDLLATGDLGDIHAIRIRNATPGADWAEWFFSPDNVSGGVVMQLGVHGIDLVQHLFGDIAEVAAFQATLKPERQLNDGRKVMSNLEDNVLARYRLNSGALITHEMSYTEVAGCDRFRLEVYAEHGTVWLRTERGQAALNAPSLTGTSDWVQPDLPDEPLGQTHHATWLDVVTGRASRDETGMAGLSTLLVAEALYQAAQSGGTVAVPSAAKVTRRA
jgi:predicted dehydrogenase